MCTTARKFTRGWRLPSLLSKSNERISSTTSWRNILSENAIHSTSCQIFHHQIRRKMRVLSQSTLHLNHQSLKNSKIFRSSVTRMIDRLPPSGLETHSLPSHKMHRNTIHERGLVNTTSTVSHLPPDQVKRKKDQHYKASFTVKEQSLADLNA